MTIDDTGPASHDSSTTRWPDVAILGAFVVLFGSMFLRWYEVDAGIEGSASVSGWQRPSAELSIIAVAAAAEVALLALVRLVRVRGIPRGLSAGIQLTSSLAAVACVALKLADESDFLGPGYYVALPALIALTIASAGNVLAASTE